MRCFVILSLVYFKCALLRNNPTLFVDKTLDMFIRNEQPSLISLKKKKPSLIEPVL
jgi:hypothetical protein